MEDQEIVGEESCVNTVREVRLEDDEEEFRSCCEDDEVWKENEEEAKDDLDKFSVKMFFKGMSIAEAGESGSGLSGIGVVMESSINLPVIQVQKRLDFYVEESVADYLALMDGLAEALQNEIRSVLAFTDSELLYQQVYVSTKLCYSKFCSIFWNVNIKNSEMDLCCKSFTYSFCNCSLYKLGSVLKLDMEIFAKFNFVSNQYWTWFSGFECLVSMEKNKSFL